MSESMSYQGHLDDRKKNRPIPIKAEQLSGLLEELADDLEISHDIVMGNKGGKDSWEACRDGKYCTCTLVSRARAAAKIEKRLMQLYDIVRKSDGFEVAYTWASGLTRARENAIKHYGYEGESVAIRPSIGVGGKEIRK